MSYVTIPANYIEITGCDLVLLVKAAYDLSVPHGLGFLHARPGSLTDEQASMLINDDKTSPVSMDYVLGRAVKMTVIRMDDKLFIAPRWFDHSDADLQALLTRIGKRS